MRDRTRRRWFENAVVYSLDIATFADGNGDGVGDVVGLIDRLDYLNGLGVDALWLLPFHRSPNRDNRYDVSDHYAIDPQLGDLGDVARLLRECEQRGIRVITELIVNHTSTDHPWFVEARHDRRSPKRDYYVWRDEKGDDEELQPVFPGVESDVWAWDDVAGQYYLHHFYSHQADLNIANPQVRDEIAKIVEFWLDLGVSGFRLDAAPYITLKASWADPTDDGMWYVRGLRELVATYGHDAVLLGEADVPPLEYASYFADGDGINVLLDFYTNGHLFLALARNDPRPIIEAVSELPPAPRGATYANWVRNHDELDLERLTDGEREEVMRRFAPDGREHIYGRGIRRRLPPMVAGDRRLVELAHSVVFGLRGIPILRYGDEIGMGDDLSLSERSAVRTAMQWAPGPSAGFSPRPPDELGVGLVTDGPFAPEHVNVAAQRGDPDSLLNAVQRLIRARRESPELGTGRTTLLTDLARHGVLGARHEGEAGVTVVLHNFVDDDVAVATPALADLVDVVELAADHPYGAPGPELALRPYGYRWLRGTRARPT